MSDHVDGESPRGSFDAALSVPEGRTGSAVAAGWLARLARDRALAMLPRLTHGRLTVHLPDGSVHRGGDAESPLHAAMWIDDERFFETFIRRGDIGFAESYVAGHFRTDDLPRLLEIGMRNESTLPHVAWLSRLLNLPHDLRHRLRRNSREGSRQNIHAHYDLSNDLFAVFLDESLVYSSAVYGDRAETLPEAQRRKFARLADAIGIDASAHVLEIGCGWGGFAMCAAQTYGCRVTGITISAAQHALATARVHEAGLSERVDIRLCDYRDVTGTYSHVVSIEMLEAVGREHWPRFFEVCHERLAPGGRLALQTIGMPDHRFETYAKQADWIQSYIFPGGMLPSLGAMLTAAAQRTPLTVRWVDDIAPHYARTLETWRRQFLDRLEEVRRLGFDDRFIRTWEYYLASCEVLFRLRQLSTLQLVMARAGE